jgi:hypothetical protein
MSDIGLYSANFFNELISYGITIPLQFKIYALVIIIFILIELYFIIIKNIPLASKYILWGFIFIVLNMINIIITFQMYMKYNKKFIGEPGLRGNKGIKGLTGENITCKICDFNIYLQKTNRYDYKMSFATNIFKLLYNQSFNYLVIYNSITDKTDIDKLLTDLYNNNLSDKLSGLSNLINYQNIVLMYDLLREIIPTYNKLSIKTPGRKRGYKPVSDVIIPEKYDNNSYVFNSDDMRYPISYNKITSIFVNEDGNGDNNNRVQYDIMKLNCPDNYKSLGVVLFNNNQTNNQTNNQGINNQARLNHLKEQYVCLNEKCLKKADVQDYKIKYIYPDSETGFVSFWMSEFNTLQIVHAQESDIKENKRLIEIIKSYNEDIYYSTGAVKKELINQLTNFYSKIQISKLSIFCYIVSTYITIIDNDFTDFKKTYISQLGIKLGIFTESKITYKNVNVILSKIDKELKDIETEHNNKLAKLYNEPVKNIINTSIDKTTLIFNAKKLTALMRKTHDFIPAYIENTHTFMDLINKVFSDGLYTRIKLKKTTEQQKKLIYLMKVLLPPSNDIYIPKNKCLVYEQINETRINLINNCEQTINKYNELITNVNNDANGDYSFSIRKEINRLNNIIIYEFDNNLSNIDNYMNKINVFNFKDFTESQLKLIIEQYNILLKKVLSKTL